MQNVQTNQSMAANQVIADLISKTKEWLQDNASDHLMACLWNDFARTRNLPIFSYVVEQSSNSPECIAYHKWKAQTGYQSVYDDYHVLAQTFNDVPTGVFGEWHEVLEKIPQVQFNEFVSWIVETGQWDELDIDPPYFLENQ